MKKRTGILLTGCTAVVLFTALLCGGCGRNQKNAQGSGSAAGELPCAQRDIYAMDTYLSVTAYGAKAEQAVSDAEAEINRLDNMLSPTKADSEIALANEGNTVKISDDTATLIKRAKEINLQTNGMFDITLYPLLCEWGFPTQEYQVPSDKKIRSLKKNTGWDKVSMDTKNSTLTLQEGTQIDLGGIAKGYLADQLRDIMENNDVPSALISLGSSTIQLVGSKPDGSDWKIAVQDPRDESKYLGVLHLSDCVVDTSGSYERWFEQDGRRYWHILNPKTGKPSRSGLSSVTVVGTDGTAGDALSTALFVMGLEDASDYWRAHSDEFEAVFVEDDGTVSITSGLQDRFVSDNPHDVIS